MSDTRASLWLRWPDEDEGPLWLGVHLNERAGENVLVGIELWTEPPGAARQTLGPAADGADDLLPWAPVALRARDLAHLSLGAVRDQVQRALGASGDIPLAAQAAAALRPLKPGRSPLYPPQHFANVAGVYLRAVGEGSRRPTAHVGVTWQVSRSTAAKWVMEARRLGYLEPD